jgi:outer membrane protein assembly factor BamB
VHASTVGIIIMKRVHLQWVFILGVLAMAASPLPARERAESGGDWPQWRGPEGLGVSRSRDLPVSWTPTANITWKTAIPGRGLSSPILWRDRIYLTTSIKGAQIPGRKAPIHPDFNGKPGYLHPDAVDVDYAHALKVLAIDARTGRIVWEQTSYDGPMYDDRHRKNTYASSTMAADGKFVYAFFESAGLYCYDLDGRLQWKVSLGGFAKAGMGPGTSPVLFDDLIILQCDTEMGDGSFLVALNRRTGKEVWRAQRHTRRSWATPLLVPVGDHVEMVAAGAEETIAYNPRTGAELWRANGTESHPIPSPVAGHGLVFMTAGSQAKRALAIKLGRSGDLTNTDAIAWRYDKGTAYVPSPILLGPYLYLMSDKGLLTCLDAITGKVIYEGGRVPVPATFTASPVAFGDRLLLTSEDGDTFVIKAGPTHEVLATNSVGEPVYASPALGDHAIYIRGEQHLFAIDASRR